MSIKKQFSLPQMSLALGVLAFGFSLVAGCGSGSYAHAVYFQCKPDTSCEKIDSMVADGYELLGQVPSVRKVITGRRDKEAVREVNDQNYDVGLIVIFDDKAGLDEYIKHPKHIEYVERNKDIWQGHRVFDFLGE